MITPQTKELFLAQALNVPTLYLKREDLHPYGSHKGRSIPHMMDHYIASGTKHFAISSSGNAALAAAIHTTKLINNGAEILLDIFIGKKIHKDKRDEIKKYEQANLITIHESERPLKDLTEFLNKNKTVKSLRQSADDVALTGYHGLADELLGIENLSAVFVATSSGTTAQALHDKFKTRNKNIEIHVIQTTSCHPIAGMFEIPETSEKSVADAIVDITALRKIPVEHAVLDSQGSGWVATNSEIRKAQDALKKYSQIDATANSALSVAGLMHAVSKDWRPKGAVCCIISGK